MKIRGLVSFGGWDGNTPVSLSPDSSPIDVSDEFGRAVVRIGQAEEVVDRVLPKKTKRGKK